MQKRNTNSARSLNDEEKWGGWRGVAWGGVGWKGVVGEEQQGVVGERGVTFLG